MINWEIHVSAIHLRQTQMNRTAHSNNQSFVNSHDYLRILFRRSTPTVAVIP